MNTATAEGVSPIGEATEAKADASVDLPLAAYLATARFGSPAGIAFLPALVPTFRQRRKR